MACGTLLDPVRRWAQIMWIHGTCRALIPVASFPLFLSCRLGTWSGLGKDLVVGARVAWLSQECWADEGFFRHRLLYT